MPRPPAHLIETVDETYRPEQEQYSPESTEYLGITKESDWKRQSYDWIQPMASNGNARQRFNSEFTDWIKSHITAEYQYDNSGFMFFDEAQLPHTDVTRDYVLLYNVIAGGAESTLCFWQEDGKQLVRERMLAVERTPRLKLIDSAKGPFDCWYLVNTRIIHSVENVTGVRINLQVSFDTDLPQSFINKYLHQLHL